MPIELGPTRAVGAVDARLVQQTPGGSPQAGKSQRSEPTVVRSEALSPGEPPVDLERVEIIRKAIASDSYPVIPAKIADAVIAAGLLLRSGK